MDVTTPMGDYWSTPEPEPAKPGKGSKNKPNESDRDSGDIKPTMSVLVCIIFTLFML